MATDLTAMRLELQDHGFTDTATARLDALLNDAYYDVASRYPWTFLEGATTIACVAGTIAPVMPTDFRAVLSLVEDATGRLLAPERSDVVDKTFAGGLTTAGQPIYYYFVGDELRLIPVPDTARTYTLKYLKAPQPMVAGADVPLIPERHRRVIVLGALIGAYRMEDDPELASVFEGQFEKRIISMLEDLSRKQFDRPERIYDIVGYEDDYSDLGY